MFGEHHDIATEFPEFKELLRELKMTDAHFAKMFDDYQEADKSVIRMEQEIETVADDILEIAKKNRLMLKDSILAQLRATAA